MAHPIIGWEHVTPVPNHEFNEFLSSRDGRLFYEDLDLTQLLHGGGVDQGSGKPLPSPLEIVYLPMLRAKVRRLKAIFAEVAAEVGYGGQFHYAYASKANTAEEVVQATLEAGAHYEMSSQVDTVIVEMMQAAGYLTPDRMVIANGFKPAGSGYSRSLIALKAKHDNLIPVLEDLVELAPFIDCGLNFDVGLRLKCYGHRNHNTKTAVDSGN
jgi:arginine decarboxylase